MHSELTPKTTVLATMGADFSRRDILRVATAGAAATFPAIALAAPDRFLVDPVRPSHQLVEWIAEYAAVNATRQLVWAQLGQLVENTPAYEKLEEDEDALFQKQCRLEDSICIEPCTNVADVLVKLDFVRRFMMDSDLDWDWQHQKILKSTFSVISHVAEG